MLLGIVEFKFFSVFTNKARQILENDNISRYKKSMVLASGILFIIIQEAGGVYLGVSRAQQ